MTTETSFSVVLRALVVYFLISVAPIWAKPSELCQKLVGVEKDSDETIEVLISLEQKLNEIQNTVFSRHVKKPEIISRLEELQATFVTTSALWEDPRVDEVDFFRELKQLATSVEGFSVYLSLLERREKVTSLEEALDDPFLLAPNQIYTIKSIDPDLTGVSFSEDVLKEVFWNTQPLMLRAHDLIYRGLQRGRRYATDKSGIIAFVGEHEVFKVKITGSAVGALRVAGFYSGRVFHVVAWAQESSHNGHNSSRLVEHVKNMKYKFEQTGSY